MNFGALHDEYCDCIECCWEAETQTELEVDDLLECDCGWRGWHSETDDERHESHGLMTFCPECRCSTDDMEIVG